MHAADQRCGGEPSLPDALLCPLRRGIVHVVHRPVPRVPRAALFRVRLVRVVERLVSVVVEDVVRVERAYVRARDQTSSRRRFRN